MMTYSPTPAQNVAKMFHALVLADRLGIVKLIGSVRVLPLVEIGFDDGTTSYLTGIEKLPGAYRVFVGHSLYFDRTEEQLDALLPPGWRVYVDS